MHLAAYFLAYLLIVLIIYRVRQHNFLISKINKTRSIYIISHILFFYNIRTSLNFFSNCFKYHQVSDVFERTFPWAPHFNKGRFGVATQASPFPPICPLVNANIPAHIPHILVIVMANTRNRFMKSMNSTQHDLHAVCHEMTLLSVSASILALTRGQIGEKGWHSKSPLIEIRRSGKWCLKSVTTWYDIQNSVKKKFKDVLL